MVPITDNSVYLHITEDSVAFDVTMDKFTHNWQQCLPSYNWGQDCFWHKCGQGLPKTEDRVCLHITEERIAFDTSVDKVYPKLKTEFAFI